ncbi:MULTISPECIES: hypothetical protein [Vibrio]|uniref:Uncharacterized protein n=2 Tax=Vibrio TaxID=662 RepID=A0AAX0MFQ8_VIBPH|nr:MULTISPECIES: hypothetical protein [Vibrio]MCA2474645.1 hypothetical protein [Vibrio alginolyticus]MCS0331163.1 hypothetical protein [Vibrio diabolicus]TVN04773.1 hypothetical protein FPV63_11260 [Vibrio cholerae]ARN69257.1 hypothetical protein FORC36_4740 [Vibrio vulnificus]EGQ8302388.1 hypothetical protein [Vibrio parahaemolyticus]
MSIEINDEKLEEILSSKAHNFTSYSLANMCLLNLEDESKYSYQMVRNGVGGWIVVIKTDDEETKKHAKKLDFFVL